MENSSDIDKNHVNTGNSTTENSALNTDYETQGKYQGNIYKKKFLEFLARHDIALY